MKLPADHRPSRRAYADATGRKTPETIRQYFDFRTNPELADRKVTRNELAAVLYSIEARRPWRRFRRWIRSWFPRSRATADELPGGPHR